MTVFTFANNQYILTMPASLSLASMDWLTSRGCQFDLYVNKDVFKIVFTFIPQEVINSIVAKHSIEIDRETCGEVAMLGLISNLVFPLIYSLSGNSIDKCLEYFSIDYKCRTLHCLSMALAFYIFHNFPSNKLAEALDEISEAVEFSLAH